MNQTDESIMEREIITKEDGRTLIYYRFIPQAEANTVDETPSEANLV